MSLRPIRCPKCYGADVSDYVDQTAFCYGCGETFWRRDELNDVRLQLWGRSQEHDPEYRSPAGRSRVRRLWDRLAELLGFN